MAPPAPMFCGPEGPWSPSPVLPRCCTLIRHFEVTTLLQSDLLQKLDCQMNEQINDCEGHRESEGFGARTSRVLSRLHNSYSCDLTRVT